MADHVPAVHPIFSDTMEVPPGQGLIDEPIETREAAQPVELIVNVEELEPHITSVNPEPERNNELTTAVRVEQAVAVSFEQHSQRPGSSLDHWSSTLLEIKQKIEPLASDTLRRLSRLDQVCISRTGRFLQHMLTLPKRVAERVSRSCYPAPCCFAPTHVLRLTSYC